MPNLDHIAAMERALDRAAAAAAALDAALAGWKAVQKDLAVLAEYMDGGNWLADYLADEAGLIPQDMKRGVLSQDALYNLLTDQARLKDWMARLAAKESANDES